MDANAIDRDKLAATLEAHTLEAAGAITFSQARARIRELIAAETWPDGWDGDEPIGESTLMPLFQRSEPSGA